MGVKWLGTEFIKSLEAAIETRMDICAQHIADEARNLMRDTKTRADKGRVMWSKGKKRTKRGYKLRYVSNPGQAPAVQTGHLARSVQWERAGRYTRRVGTNVKYGLYLELGTRKMRARPWLRPAMLRSKDFVEKQLREVM